MYRKAYYFDEDTIFYFDVFDNKWIARNGSLAWRTNNPGLLQTHQLVRQSAISHHHRVAIFPSINAGMSALGAWLLEGNLKKQFILQVAEHLQPESTNACLDQLCALTNLPRDFSRRSMSSEAFAKLIDAIKKLTGFSDFQNSKFTQLPKIQVRYYSDDGKADHYLTSSNDFLKKSEAIDWVEEHRLDAVIVHKKTALSIYALVQAII